MIRRARGATLIETMCLLPVGLLVCGIVAGGMHLANRGERSIADRDEDHQALVAARETLRRDLLRMVIQDPVTDLQVAPGGAGLTMMLAGEPGEDPWSLDAVPVAYRMSPAPAGNGSRTLVRIAGEEVRPVPGCTGMEVRVIPRGERSAFFSYLEIELSAVVGRGTSRRDVRSGLVVPVRPIPVLMPYTVEED